MASQAAGEEQPPPPLITLTGPQQWQQLSGRRFPPAFNMYLDSSCREKRRFVIGEHKGTPLYAVTTHPPARSSGPPNLVLHNGLQDDSPPLAAVYQNRSSHASTVELPPLDGLPLPDNARVSVVKIEENSANFRSTTYTFTVQTGGPGSHLEAFQWRHSSGKEVRALDARGHGDGWKLVRLAPDAPAVDGATFASDGREVVAVWKKVYSATKKLKFQFLGTGATGALGEPWALMAVASALKIWDSIHIDTAGAHIAGISGGGAFVGGAGGGA
ncbi:hypothetical protein Hte_003402 [Hypoxylon texense]